MSTITSSAFSLVIFGATGNLAQLKLLPALYHLSEEGLFPEHIQIIGVGRKPMSHDAFQAYTRELLHHPQKRFIQPVKKTFVDKLVSTMRYVAGDIHDPSLYTALHQELSSHTKCTNKLYYLATYPDLYQTIFEQLEQAGLNSQQCGWTRVVIEKPLGTDFETARALNKTLARYYQEDQIFRLDHYLGRETLQNILTFRFGNGLFEPLMHRNYIDHIQVTAAEDFGIGLRGGYYDHVGALKDIGQNHVLQMITLATMNPPTSFSNEAVTRRRIELLEELVPEPSSVVFGQYEGYVKESGIEAHSRTDTFFAFKTHINNDRFNKVPIYVRGGKSLARTVTEVAIVFTTAGKRLFDHVEGGVSPNMLIYRVQPNEGIVWRFVSKKPGPGLKLQDEYMQFCYKQDSLFHHDPYLTLLVDMFQGDQTFFIDAPEVEAQWKFIDNLTAAKHTLYSYKPGSWGPSAADKLIQADGRSWIEPSTDFCAR
jgi:glucose-6-phosphate 1-dehydrogenase